MKFLILINAAPNYKYYFFVLAKELQTRGHDVTFAVDSRRSTFLEPINDLDNSSNTFFFDDYLKKHFNKDITLPKISNEYWGDVFYSDFDRFLTHSYNLDKEKNYWLNIKNNLDNFFHKIISENNIDYILYENISNSFSYSAYKIGMNLNCHYIGLMGSRIPNHFEIQCSVIERELDRIDYLSSLPLTEAEISWYNEYKKNIASIQPDYMRMNGLDNVNLTRLLKAEKFRKFFNLLFISHKYEHFYDYMFGDPRKTAIKAIRVNMQRKLNSKFALRAYTDNNELKSNLLKEDYYVYPIHFHPESSTSVLAPEYTNEYSNIINIANNLPYGTYLYVKDHKSAIGTQDRSFYRKISSLPNVRLIHPEYNIKHLIRKSIGVITINSTAGYEALLLDKPVYIFGRVFYERFPNVHKLSTFKDIRNIEDKKFEVSNMMEYFVAYKRYCYEGVVNILAAKSNPEPLYFKNIVDKIILHINNH